MTSKKIFALLILSSIVAVCLLLPLTNSGLRTKTTDTLSTIRAVLTDIDLLADDKGIIETPFSNNIESLLLNQNMAAFLLLQSSSNSNFTSGKLMSKAGFFCDAWGTPLWFTSTNGPMYEQLNPELKGKHRPFVVWSAGPNRTNEFGNGDDIFSRR